MSAVIYFIGCIECVLIACGMYAMPAPVRVAAVAFAIVCAARCNGALRSPL